MKLKIQWAYLVIAGALAVVLVVASVPDGPFMSTDSEAAGRTPTGTAAEVTAAPTLDGQSTDGSGAGRSPCTDGDCKPRNVSTLNLFSGSLGANSALAEPDPAASVEEVLEKGLRLAEVSPVHIAFRGTADAGSVRCEWRGIAMTPDQREDAIRFWLGFDEDDEIPDTTYLEALFTATIRVLEPAFQETAKSSARPPGLQVRIEYL